MGFVTEIDGLPLHPLVVHAAVVLVPLAAIAVAVVGWRPSWRRSYLLPIGLLAAAGWLSAYVATLSGGSMESHVRRSAAAAGLARPRFGDHPEIGEQAALVAFAFMLLVGAFFVVDRWSGRRGLPTWLPTAAYALSSLVGLLATLAMVRAGHTGAELAWRP